MKDELLKRVVGQYRKSQDFNGLHFTGKSDAERTVAAALVRDGLVQVVSEEDYPNPHIRPWPSMRSVDEQANSIAALDGTGYGVCLYPTPLALSKRNTRRAHRGQPFRQVMTKGRGHLS